MEEPIVYYRGCFLYMLYIICYFKSVHQSNWSTRYICSAMQFSSRQWIKNTQKICVRKCIFSSILPILQHSAGQMFAQLWNSVYRKVSTPFSHGLLKLTSTAALSRYPLSLRNSLQSKWSHSTAFFALVYQWEAEEL